MQHRADAIAPTLLVVLAARGFEVRQILAEHPSLRDERIAQARAHRQSPRRLRAVPASSQIRCGSLAAQRLDLAQNHAVVPPDRRRQHGELAERRRDSGARGASSASPPSDEPPIAVFAAPGSVLYVAVDERLELLDEHAAVVVGVSAAALVRAARVGVYSSTRCSPVL